MKKRSPKFNKIGFYCLIIGLSLTLAILGFKGETRAAGASLYFSPSSGTFFVGSTLDISVFVNTGGNDINAIRVDLKFDPKKLQITTPTAGRSFIALWVTQPTYSNIEGTASFQGGVPAPGINTSSGLVSTITFRAIAPGETEIYFLDSSQVLLADGKGTNVLTSMGRGMYKLTIPPPEGPEVFSPTHPDQNKWYKNNNPTFSWRKDEDVTDFSYYIDQDFGGVPDNISEGSHTSIAYTDLEDGVWYFHLKARKGSFWGGVSHYIVQVDKTSPALFRLSFDPVLHSPVMTSREPILSFITTDALSGLEHYEIKIIDLEQAKAGITGFFFEVSSPYRVQQLAAGEYEIVIRAFDRAGNWRDAAQRIEVVFSDKLFFISKSGVQLWVFFLTWSQLALFLVVLILMMVIMVYLWWRKHKALHEKQETLEEMKDEATKRSEELKRKMHA